MNLLDGVELQRGELRAFRESMRADFAEFRTEIERQLAAGAVLAIAGLVVSMR